MAQIKINYTKQEDEIKVKGAKNDRLSNLR